VNLHLDFFSVGGFALSFGALGVGTTTSVMVTWPYGLT
jgi:hypothetical protein